MIKFVYKMQIQSVTVFYQYNTKNINETNYENAIRAKKAYVYKDERFSDHAPLIIEYK